jgi:hypothetical protein
MHVTTRRSRAARRRSSRPASHNSGPAAMRPFLKIIGQCLNNFVLRFGRYPGLDEPLLFDPQAEHPVCASRREMRSQVIAAAKAARVDAGPLLEFLGLVPKRTKSNDPHES